MQGLASKSTISNRKVPEGLRKLLGEANSKYLTKQYADAKARCEMLIGKHPKLPDSYHLLGAIYQEMGYKEKALQMYKLAAKYEYDSADYELWMQVASFAEEIGDIQSALEAYKTASQRIKYSRPKKAQSKEEVEEPNVVEVPNLMGLTSSDFYHGCNFESYEKLAALSEKFGNYSEACKALRFMLRSMEVPRIDHLKKLIELFDKRELSPHKLSLALEFWVQPLLLTKNDSRVTNEPLNSIPERSDVENCVVHFNIFEKYLICLLVNRQYLRALGCLVRFKLFLKNPTRGRYSYLHNAKPPVMPPIFFALQGCCLVFLDRLDSAKAIREEIFQMANLYEVQAKVFYVFSEAYYEKSLFDDCLITLKRTETKGNYYKGIVYDAQGDISNAIRSYKSLLKHKCPNGEGNFLITRSFTQEKVDKKVVASRLFELLWVVGKKDMADKVYSKFLLQEGEETDPKYEKNKLLAKLAKAQEKQDIIEMRLPRLLDLNYTMPKVGREREDSIDEYGKHFSKRRRIFKPKTEPMNIAVTLRKTTKKTKSLRGDLRPHTLQQISSCEHALGIEDYKTCITVGLDLLYPFFGNAELACVSYQKLADLYPPDESTPDTLLKDDEVMLVFKYVLLCLMRTEKLVDGVNLAVDLYKSSPCAFDKLKDNTECLGLVIYLCLLSQDFENLAKIIVSIINEFAVVPLTDTENHERSKFQDNLSIEKATTLLSVLQYVLRLHSSNKNLPRMIKRLLSSNYSNANASDKTLVSLFIMLAQHELDSSNTVRALIILLQARKMCPENPFVNLYCAVCYLRFNSSRTVENPNKTLLLGLAYLTRYIESRGNKMNVSIKAETLYNSAVFFHKSGLKFLAENLYSQILQIYECPRGLRTQAAFGLSSIYKHSNPELARQVIQRHMMISLSQSN